MKQYSINRWNELFENNRSRSVETLTWVKVPNRHDGENYSTVITHPQGAEIFSAWILMLQVASRCQPRGSLVRGNGKPHNSETLSSKTRAPKKWFDLAIDYLTKNTDWLTTQDVAHDCQAAVSQLAADCQASALEWNGIEENSSTPLNPPKGDVSKSKKGPLQLRAEKLMNRRPETPLTDSEQRAFKKSASAIKATTEEDWILLEAFYAAPQTETYSRKDLATLVNNWNGEIDRAKAWQAAKSHSRPIPAHELKTAITSIDEQIATHPANKDSIYHKPDCAQDVKDQLRALRTKAAALRSQLATV